MSIADPMTGTTKSGSQHSTRSSEDREELSKLDSIFDRIRKCVPAAPYVLAVPSDRPYQHYSRHESQSWMLGHLFEPHEENLQYRTFHYREPYVSCFVTESGEEEAPREERSTKAQGLNTPQQGPKKKISLSAYKAKQANGVITPGSKKLSPEIGPARPDQPQANGVKEPVKATYSAEKVKEPQPQKRTLDESADSRQPRKPTHEGQPPTKKTRASRSPDLKRLSDVSAPSNGTPHGLPPLLSPVGTTLPNPYGLPPILSPTLPSNIQTELDRIETQRKRAESNASSSSDKKNQYLSVPEAKIQKREEGTKSTARTVGKSPNASQTPSPAGSKPQSQAQRDSRLSNSQISENRLVVKLKFSKSYRTRVKQLLRLPPKAAIAAGKKERQEDQKERLLKRTPKVAEPAPAKEKETSKQSSRKADVSVSSSSNIDNNTRSKSEKRGRAEDDATLLSAPSSKRQKPQDSDRNPSTPIQQMISSPALSNKSSAQKSQSQGAYNTPRKDFKALNMVRTSSTEGNDATPGRLDGKLPPTSAPVNGKKHADLQVWSQVSQKLNNMGRSLKHESQKIAEKGDQMTKEDRKRAAVMGLECILSYMASFHVTDIGQNLRGRPGEVENTWKTLLPLSMSYSNRTKDIPHLDGLRLYLSTVISACISGLVAQRSRSKTNHDSPHDTPQADSSAGNLSLLSDHVLRLLRCSLEARVALPFEDIMSQYPKTYKRRETETKPTKEVEKLPVGVLSGPYFLPIGIDTTPIQAVRFGLQFLSEWIDKEGLNYTLRVSLEKSD